MENAEELLNLVLPLYLEFSLPLTLPVKHWHPLDVKTMCSDGYGVECFSLTSWLLNENYTFLSRASRFPHNGDVFRLDGKIKFIF